MATTPASLVFAALLELHARGEKFGTENVRAQLISDGTFKSVGEDYLLALANRATPAFGATAIRVLQRQVELRRLSTNLMNALKCSTSGDLEATQALCDELSADALGLQAGSAMSLRQAAINAGARVVTRWEVGDSQGTVAPGLNCLEFAIGNLSKGNLIVVGADTGVGKTSIALLMALQQESAVPVGIVSCEDAEDVFGERALAYWSEVSSLRMRTGLTNQELGKLKQTLEVAPSPRIHLEFQIGKNDHDVRCAMRRLRYEHNVGIIYVDYLQAIADSERQFARKDQVREVLSRIKGQAEALGVPVVVMSQMSRPQKGAVFRQPTKHDLKESGDIENSAEVILLLWLDEESDEKDKAEDAPDVVWLKIDKCKWGMQKKLFRFERTDYGGLKQIGRYESRSKQGEMF